MMSPTDGSKRGGRVSRVHMEDETLIEMVALASEAGDEETAKVLEAYAHFIKHSEYS